MKYWRDPSKQKRDKEETKASDGNLLFDVDKTII